MMMIIHIMYILNMFQDCLIKSATKKDTENYCPYCNTCFNCFYFSNQFNKCYNIQFKEGSLMKLPSPPESENIFKTIMKFCTY